MKINPNNITIFTFQSFDKVNSGSGVNNKNNGTSSGNDAVNKVQRSDQFQRGISFDKVTYGNIKVNGAGNSINSIGKNNFKPVLSLEERNFFEKLYPDSSSVKSYQIYQNLGSNTITTPGQILNRRG